MHIPGEVGAFLRVLWLLAGTAMLFFVVLISTLAIAGCGFRLGWRRGTRRSSRSPRVVFALAAVAALLPTLLLLPFSPLRSSATHSGCELQPTQRSRDGSYLSANKASAGKGVPGSKARALVLYETGGDQSALQETSAEELANLASHFGTWTAQPVSTYRAHAIAGYDAVLYLGGSSQQQLPEVFLDDVLESTKQVLWIGEDVGQLQYRNPRLWAGRYGFHSKDVETATVGRVDYKGVALKRDTTNGWGLMSVSIDDPARVAVLASALRPDGSTFPWAVRSDNLTFVAENPFTYTELGDRYLAFSDLLFDVLAPNSQQRHRALVRLEDVGPTADPAKLREIAEYLNRQHVPFSFGVYPVYRDPHGTEHGGKDTTIRLADRPAVARAIKYMISCGGTIVLHGYTHQFGAKNNPSDGVSANDYEFYSAHLDSQDNVQLDGPVPGDSEAWALARIDRSLAELHAAGLPTPQIFEFPHYAASAADYRAVSERFPYRYERSLYFPGLFSGRPADDAHRDSQFFPYTVRDVYGTEVIPENMDYFIAASYNHNQAHGVSDLLETARRNLVVRDGTTSFFYHHALGLGELPRIVQGVRSLGYIFVSPYDLLASP